MRIIKHIIGLLAGTYAGYVIWHYYLLSKLAVVVNILPAAGNAECSPMPFVIVGGIIGLLFPWLAIISCILMVVLSSFH